MDTLTTKIKAAASGQIAILGIPFDKNSSFLAGSAEAPPTIRQELYSDARNLWTESGLNLAEALADCGDLDCAQAERVFSDIHAVVSLMIERGLKPISLGGDHSVTYPIVKALSKKYPDLNILQIDAHPDLYQEFEGNLFSHACPFARIMEDGLARRLVQVGIRTMNGHQREQARRFGVETIEMRAVRNGVPREFEGPLYISIDMDALDPACAPGVSHPEPGGFTTRELVDLIQSLKANVVAADIVELNPRRDLHALTAVTAAKLLKEIAAKML